MDTNTRNRAIDDILCHCDSLTREELDVLTDDQINEIDATDTRWCQTDEDISLALFSTYEYLDR